MDVDGVLADFNSGYVERIKAVTGVDRFEDPPRMDEWHYAEAAGYTPKELRAVWRDINADSGFWLNLAPLDDLDAARLWTQRQRGDTYFITARPGDTTKRQTERWLEYYGFYRPTVLMSGDKAACCDALRLEEYLDDNWQNACEVAETETRSYLLTRSWNVQFCELPPNLTRVASVAEFFAAIV